MCGRFITTGTWAEYRRYLNILSSEVDSRNGPEPNYNVAPTSQLEIVVREGDENVIAPVVWGLVPHWAKDSKIKLQINARGETVAEKPFFRTAFAYRRCLIPATGYYEWRTESGVKQPYLIHLPGERPVFETFAFAGVMAHNTPLGLSTFAIVTLPTDPAVADIHNRMPVILKPDALASWMDTDTIKDDALELLRDNRGSDLVYYLVDRAVGNVRNKEPELIQPV